MWNMYCKIKVVLNQSFMLMFFLGIYAIPNFCLSQAPDCQKLSDIIKQIRITNNMDSAEILCRNAIEFSKSNNCESYFSALYYHLSNILNVKSKVSEAKIFAEEAFKHGTISKNNTDIGNALMMQAVFLRAENNIIGSNELLDEAKNYFVKDNNNSRLAKCYINIANNYRLSDYSKAIEFYLKAIAFFEKDNDPKGLADAYNNIGYVYVVSGQIEKARSNYRKSISVSESIRDSNALIYSYLNLADSYSMGDTVDNILKYIEISSLMNGRDSSKLIWGNILSVYGHYYLLKKDFQNAEICLLAQLKIFEKYKVHRNILSAKNSLAELYYTMEKCDSAINIYNSFLDDVTQNAVLLMNCKYTMALAFECKLDYKNAFLTLFEYTSLKDTVLNEEKVAAIQDLETKYETAKKEAEIQKQKLELRNKNLGMGLMGSLLLAIAGIAYYLFQSRKKEKEVSQFLDFQNEGLRNSNFNLSSALQSLKKKEQQEEEQEMEIVINNGYNSKVKLKDILYIEAENNLLKIYLVDGTIRHDYQRLKSFAELLLNSQLFIQIHRSYIVNKMYIVDRRANEVRMQNDVQIPIGITYKEKFNLSMKGE